MTHRLLILDNYDSFTYNLLHYCETFPGIYAEVKRNDEVSADYAAGFDSILFSPGPGLPSHAGIMPDLISRWHASRKMLGVCLGMQALGEFFGARLINSDFPMHGRVSECRLSEVGSPLFAGIPEVFPVGRYHSWSVDAHSLSSDLQALAFAQDGSLQAMQHKHLPLYGVQFHPESIMTPHGKQLVFNWLNIEIPARA
jgi:anthranilate synthase component 2